MHDLGIVLETLERTVLVAETGQTMKSLMAVTLYRLPHPTFVLTRETSMPNANGVTVSFMVIPGTTIRECCESLEKMSLNILSPVNSFQRSGQEKSFWE
mgnify:CR=1 FL=1